MKIKIITVVTLILLLSNYLLADILTCQKITSVDLGIPANVVGYSTNEIDVSSKFNLPDGAIYVQAIKANTFSGGNFRVGETNYTTFEISGYTPVRIKVNHGGILGAESKDEIFIGQNSSGYAFISALPEGLVHGENGNPGYYVENITKSKIYSEDFVWLSVEPETHIRFGTTATGKFNSRIGLKLCIPQMLPKP